MKFQIRQNYGLLILSLFWKCQKGQKSQNKPSDAVLIK